LSQPGSNAILAAASQKSNGDKARHCDTFHDVPGALANQLCVSGCPRQSLARSREVAAEEILEPEDQYFLDGAETFVDDLGLLDEEMRLDLAGAV
jgi:hypothetical protein